MFLDHAAPSLGVALRLWVRRCGCECTLLCRLAQGGGFPVQCFNVKLEEPLSEEQAATLTWLLRETFEPELLTPGSSLRADAATDAVVEVRHCG